MVPIRRRILTVIPSRRKAHNYNRIAQPGYQYHPRNPSLNQWTSDIEKPSSSLWDKYNLKHIHDECEVYEPTQYNPHNYFKFDHETRSPYKPQYSNFRRNVNIDDVYRRNDGYDTLFSTSLPDSTPETIAANITDATEEPKRRSETQPENDTTEHATETSLEPLQNNDEESTEPVRRSDDPGAVLRIDTNLKDDSERRSQQDWGTNATEPPSDVKSTTSSGNSEDTSSTLSSRRRKRNILEDLFKSIALGGDINEKNEKIDTKPGLGRKELHTTTKSEGNNKIPQRNNSTENNIFNVAKRLAIISSMASKKYNNLSGMQIILQSNPTLSPKNWENLQKIVTSLIFLNPLTEKNYGGIIKLGKKTEVIQTLDQTNSCALQEKILNMTSDSGFSVNYGKGLELALKQLENNSLKGNTLIYLIAYGTNKKLNEASIEIMRRLSREGNTLVLIQIAKGIKERINYKIPNVFVIQLPSFATAAKLSDIMNMNYIQQTAIEQCRKQ